MSNKNKAKLFLRLKVNFLNLYTSIIAKDSWKKIKKCDVLLLKHDNNHNYLYENKKYSTLIDSIAYFYEKNGYTYQTVAKPFSRFIGEGVSGKPLSVNSSYFIYGVLNKVFKKLFNSNVFNRTSLWIRVLERAKPTIVIGVQPDMYTCQACYLANIPVYDLQHGAIESSVRHYSSVKVLSDPSYALPSGFLLWNKNSKETLRRLMNIDKNLFVVGHPFLSRFQKNLDDDRLVKSAFDEWNAPFVNNKPNILVTTQYGLKEYYKTDFDILPRELIELIKETQDIYNFFLRAHPVDRNKQISFFIDEFSEYSNSINFIEVTEMPLPILLSYTSLHITYHSAVTLECSMYGLKTILLNPELGEGRTLETLFLDERENGLAELVTINKDKMSESIKNSLDDSQQFDEMYLNTELEFLKLYERNGLPYE